MSLWQSVIASIEAGCQPSELSDAILQAAFLLEKASAQAQPISSAGITAIWTDEVLAEPVDLPARGRLVETLVRVTTERPDDSRVASMFWALGKAGDPALVPFLRRALRDQLTRNPDAAYQILIALEDLGERPYPTEGTRSSLDHAENLRIARAYLTRIGGDAE